MTPRRRPGPATLAFVESPVQLLNVLEWAHARLPRATRLPDTPEPDAPNARAVGTTAGAGGGARGGAGAPDGGHTPDPPSGTGARPSTGSGPSPGAGPASGTGRGADGGPASGTGADAGVSAGPGPGGLRAGTTAAAVASPAGAVRTGARAPWAGPAPAALAGATVGGDGAGTGVGDGGPVAPVPPVVSPSPPGAPVPEGGRGGPATAPYARVPGVPGTAVAAPARAPRQPGTDGGSGVPGVPGGLGAPGALAEQAPARAPRQPGAPGADGGSGVSGELPERNPAPGAPGEPQPAPGAPARAGTAEGTLPGPASAPGAPPEPEPAPGALPEPGSAPGAPGPGGWGDLTLVVLAPTDPMTRGQLRRMAELARGEGCQVRWEEARGGGAAPFRTIGGLAPLLRRARRIVIGDPFSRYVQLLLAITPARDLVVVDDGTATMEFVTQLARGERLVRWHRRGGRPGPRDLLFAPVSSVARRRLTPGERHARRDVEIFSSMPISDPPPRVRTTVNAFAWTRARFGPPRVTKGADLVGTSLVETGVVDQERYLAAVTALAREHGATRYFAHRREDTAKLHRLATDTGLEIVRPDLPLELIARRGPVGRTIVSFPSTVVHTLPLALAGTGVRVAVCDVDPAWLTGRASPRAQGFLSGVTASADADRLTTPRA